MSFLFCCPYCHNLVEVPDSWLGRDTTCKHCGHRDTIVDLRAPPRKEKRCSHCHRSFPAEQVQRRFWRVDLCPECAARRAATVTQSHPRPVPGADDEVTWSNVVVGSLLVAVLLVLWRCSGDLVPGWLRVAVLVLIRSI
jgi:hypothetical protein